MSPELRALEPPSRWRKILPRRAHPAHNVHRRDRCGVVTAVKMPVYGIPGVFAEADFNGVHRLNERIRVRSLYEGRDYMFDLVKLLAEGK
jgi:hypothetical protein